LKRKDREFRDLEGEDAGDASEQPQQGGMPAGLFGGNCLIDREKIPCSQGNTSAAVLVRALARFAANPLHKQQKRRSGFAGTGRLTCD
jgi:hypothetical protein